MNTKYAEQPEVIAWLRKIDSSGDDIAIGTRVAGVGIAPRKQLDTPVVQLDIRDFQKNTNLLVEIELSELVSAISLASVEHTPDDK